MMNPPKAEVLHIICERDVGLFNLVLGVIAHVHWARSEGRIPIAYFGRDTCYWTPHGYRDRDSVWEYYFEPLVRGYPASRIPPRIARWILDHPRMEGKKAEFVDESSFVTRNGGRHVNVDGEQLRGPPEGVGSRAIRELASRIVSDCIRPREYILAKAERFARENMAGRFVIGVHIRGTDSIGHPGLPARRRRVNMKKYCAILRRRLLQKPEALIFVASDTHDYVDQIRNAFGDRVISYARIRHEGGAPRGTGPRGAVMPAFLTQDRDRAAASGEEAVVDYLLLCRCGVLVHNLSAIPRAVLLTVPDMPEVTVEAPLGAVTAARRYVATSASTPALWLRRAKAARDAIAGKPMSDWYRSLRDLWIERKRRRTRRTAQANPS